MINKMLNGHVLFRVSAIGIVLSVFFSSCLPPIIRKAPKGRYYIVKNSIEVKGGNLSKTEKTDLSQKLFIQLADSSLVPSKDMFLFLHVIKHPPVFDTSLAEESVRNLNAAVFHQGFYHASVKYKADSSGKKIKLTYSVDCGPPTRINKLEYQMRDSALQELAISNAQDSKLTPGGSISKLSVLEEINRMVGLFRDNGYYKFTSSELKVRGDTTAAALTTLTDDPLEQIRILKDLQSRKDSPKIDISIVLNPPADSSKIKKFRFNNIFIYPDLDKDEKIADNGRKCNYAAGMQICSKQELFRPGFISRNIFIRPGEIYNETAFNRTINALTRTGVWQSITLNIKEVPDSTGLIDVYIEMIPGKNISEEIALEASYLSSNNATSALAGNLLGLSMNLAISNKNLGREAIRMTHSLRTGIELNNNRGLNTKLISSNDISYTNSIILPKLIFPKIASVISQQGESFISTSVGYNKRVSLFDLQSFNLGIGWSAPYKRNAHWKVLFKPLNVEFTFPYNETDSFKNILKKNIFLQYSYNPSYVAGMSLGLSNTRNLGGMYAAKSRERSLRLNLEESGLTWANIPVAQKYLRRFIKADVEWKYSFKFPKTVLALRGFGGFGLPLLGSDTNRSLPYFKQFFAGGINSMRGWPARGLGIGGQPRVPFNSSQTIFNDRTGDIQLEGNVEYRYQIMRIIPNALNLRGTVFFDMGNIWNVRSEKKNGIDSSQFQFKNLYKQLGASVGTGLVIDFNYVVLRLDLGFRLKRPDLFYVNDGWKLPSIGFDDVFKKLLTKGTNGEYRQWRYDNFNFGIGIGYAF